MHRGRGLAVGACADGPGVASGARAGVVDSPLPTFSDGAASTAVLIVPGTVKRGRCNNPRVNVFTTAGNKRPLTPLAGSGANLGGLGAGGTSKTPPIFVDPASCTFQVPAGTKTSLAYVQGLNPPFIPYASSGNDPDGAFTPAVP